MTFQELMPAISLDQALDFIRDHIQELLAVKPEPLGLPRPQNVFGVYMFLVDLQVMYAGQAKGNDGLRDRMETHFGRREPRNPAPTSYSFLTGNYGENISKQGSLSAGCPLRSSAAFAQFGQPGAVPLLCGPATIDGDCSARDLVDCGRADEGDGATGLG
jgi:hypothetical protein